MIAAVIALVFGIILAQTRFGRYTYAIGSNEEGVRRAGVNVDRHLIKVYALCGALAGLAGALSLARFGTTSIAGNTTLNLDAIAAIVIGGTSLFGGVGTIIGTVVGVFIPAVLRNGFVIVGVQPFWQQVAVGAVLIIAVYIDQLRRAKLRAVTSTPLLEERSNARTFKAGIAGRSPRCLFAASLGLVACGDDDEGGGGGAAGGDDYKMTLIAGVKGDEFYITMNCGAQAEAEKQGVTLDFQGPDQFDASLQTPIVNGVIAKKPDAILIAPTDAKAMYAPIKQAADAGIKIVLVDTTLENADMAVSQIASDNVGGGKAAAKALADAIGGSGKVFVNNVKPGISTTDQRAQGFEEEAKNLGLEYVGMEYNQDQPDKAAAITKGVIAKYPDLKGIFAHEPVRGRRLRGRPARVRQHDVKIVGFDAGPKQVKDLEEGLLQALVAQKPADIGAQGVQQAVAALKGEPTKEKIGTGSTILTKDNLADNQDAVYKSTC